MNVYNWETAGAARRRKVKKTGTVVFHTDEQVDTAFDRLQKEVLVQRLHLSQKEAEEALTKAPNHANSVKTALMTAATANVLQQKLGFEQLLPCQAQCYRGIFNGRDVILHSRTGSGKTLAYALPLVERHLLLEQKQQELLDTPPGPFLLIFVFSNDLAMQTRAVLEKIYGERTGLRIAVAGFDDLQPTSSAAGGTRNTLKGASVDILIGTVRTIDEAIRGHRVAAVATAAEEAEMERESRLLGRKRRHDAQPSKKQPTEGSSAVKRKVARGGGDGAVDYDAVAATSDSDLDSDDEGGAEKQEGDDNEAPQEEGLVIPARVRAIVVDEVDITLGPRFSAVGRRMKNLLKFIRKANGSLAEGLLNDFRAHHYVLCGATIPNWVLKAGFLGVKKYFYQLVAVGSAKLPPQLECYHEVCPMSERVQVATRLLVEHATFMGRVVVFGTLKQLASLEAGLLAASAAAAAATQVAERDASPASLPRKKKNPKKMKDDGKQAPPPAKSLSSSSGAAASASPSSPVARVMTSQKDEVERVAAIEDFNSGVAQVLLCTDMAARGLDFVSVDTVLMLSLPRDTLASDTFVHRAGRTARVGRPGRCILLHDASETAVVDAIAKSTHAVFKALRPALAVAAAAVAVDGPASKLEKRKAGSAVVETAPSEEASILMRLVVRNPFRYTKPDVKVPSAMHVFNKNVDGSLRAALKDIREGEPGSNGGEVVLFRVPASHLHEVKQCLWRYTLQEV